MPTAHGSYSFPNNPSTPGLNLTTRFILQKRLFENMFDVFRAYIHIVNNERSSISLEL